MVDWIFENKRIPYAQSWDTPASLGLPTWGFFNKWTDRLVNPEHHTMVDLYHPATHPVARKSLNFAKNNITTKIKVSWLDKMDP